MKLSIGQVSKLYDISLDTLRHYDKIDLLKPEVNPNNGYRYYSFQHMDQLGLILGTKELGISLSDIKDIIKSEDINEYKNLILRQEQLIKEKIKQLEKLEKRIEENKGLFDTIIGFENEYDFSKLKINKNKYT
ncbi:MAG: MerR family transcriptional regulator, partial [Romboutsia sp.]|uniref:MerR family transcriptional regulator n=1 Tax=Romboutsia sp. TaxID=1965302 RepID=UPI003F3FE0CD